MVGRQVDDRLEEKGPLHCVLRANHDPERRRLTSANERRLSAGDHHGAHVVRNLDRAFEGLHHRRLTVVVDRELGAAHGRNRAAGSDPGLAVPPAHDSRPQPAREHLDVTLAGAFVDLDAGVRPDPELSIVRVETDHHRTGPRRDDVAALDGHAPLQFHRTPEPNDVGVTAVRLEGGEPRSARLRTGRDDEGAEDRRTECEPHDV